MDPSTLRIIFDSRSTTSCGSGLNIYPICGPWSFYSRMRIQAGGHENIESDYRIHELTQICSATEHKENAYAECVGNM